MLWVVIKWLRSWSQILPVRTVPMLSPCLMSESLESNELCISFSCFLVVIHSGYQNNISYQITGGTLSPFCSSSQLQTN